jgi:hypothetical protein
VRLVYSVVARTVWARSRRKQQIRENNCGKDHPAQTLSRRGPLDMNAANWRIKSLGKDDGRCQRS